MEANPFSEGVLAAQCFQERRAPDTLLHLHQELWLQGWDAQTAFYRAFMQTATEASARGARNIAHTLRVAKGDR